MTIKDHLVHYHGYSREDLDRYWGENYEALIKFHDTGVLHFNSTREYNVWEGTKQYIMHTHPYTTTNSRYERQ